jgi:hypothetical protein
MAMTCCAPSRIALRIVICPRVAEHLVGHIPVPVGSLADGEAPPLAAADNREWDNDAVSDLQCPATSATAGLFGYTHLTGGYPPGGILHP